MPGKRKRNEASGKEPENIPHPNATTKPLSAIAAARLRAAVPVVVTDDLQEPPKSPLSESSVSEAAYSEAEEVPPIHQNFKLGTWRKHQENILSNTPKELTIVLEKHATAAIVGCFEVKVLKGAVHINGANIGTPSKGSKDDVNSHRVFVPSTNPIFKIRGLDRTNHVQLRNCQEPTPFADISPLFADIWSGGAESDKGRSFTILAESDDDPLGRELVPEHAPEDWLRTIDDISTTASVTLAIGPVSSGKSTFAKRLLNRYLTGFGKTAKAVPAVCYLDLDHTNPEYTTHGQISLTIVRQLNLGPSFTHLTTPEHSDGNETIASHVLPIEDLIHNEEYFNSCVEDLLQTYQNLRLDGPTPPLIINTSGNIYVWHFHMLQKLITSAKPNYLAHFGDRSSIDEETAEKLHSVQLLAHKTRSTLQELAAQFPTTPPARSAAELRAMQMQSYFHLTGQFSSQPATYTASPLNTLRPWTFSYQETQYRTQDFLGILPLFELLDPSQLLTALNGALVQIVSTTDASFASHFNQIPRTPESQIPYFEPDVDSGMPQLPRPGNTKFICTALIRGIDPSMRTIQVLVPKSHEHLLEDLEPENIVFVAGCCDTPDWAYTEDAYAQVAQRRRDLGERARFASEDMLTEGIELAPWVAKKSVVDGMGYLNTARRVRKFLG